MKTLIFLVLMSLSPLFASETLNFNDFLKETPKISDTLNQLSINASIYYMVIDFETMKALNIRDLKKYIEVGKKIDKANIFLRMMKKDYENTIPYFRNI